MIRKWVEVNSRVIRMLRLTSPAQPSPAQHPHSVEEAAASKPRRGSALGGLIPPYLVGKGSGQAHLGVRMPLGLATHAHADAQLCVRETVDDNSTS